MFDFIILQLSTLGPLGRKLPAPGTVGSIVGIFLFGFLHYYCELQILWIVALSIPLVLLGVPICTHAERILGEPDPKSVIWDEFSVIPFIFLFLKDSDLRHSDSHFLFFIGLGFCLFRLFDILKPIGINKLQNLPRGWGVMTDDFAAALISACLLGIIQTFSLSFL